LSAQNPSPGDVVILTGANFLAGSTTIAIGGVPVSVRVLSSTQLTFTVPATFFGGLAIGIVGSVPQATAASFRILPPPSIISVSGTTAVVGRVMTVNGVNFRNMVDVSVGGVSTSFTALDSTGERLSVVVPTMPGLDSTAAELTTLEATIAVQTRSGLATYQHFFSNRPISTSATATTATTSLVMRISGISPLTLSEGSSVLLQGVNIPTTAVVMLNNKLLTTATVQGSTMISCPIPPGFVPFPLLSTTAQFSVSTTALTATQDAISLVPAPALVRVEALDSPQLLSFQPMSGNLETVIVIAGQNFDTTATAEQPNSRPKRGTVRSISIGGLPVASWRVISPALISTTVGLVRTGVVRIETASGALVSQDIFFFDTTGQAAASSAALLGPVALKDSLALNRLYAATNGASWTISTNAAALSGGGARWVSAVPVALRFGVKVESRRVVELRLPNIGLKGTIPPDVLRDLDSIRVLDLSGNLLTGSIPQEIENDTYLERLRLGGNALGGTIPRGLCALTRLKELDIAGNAVVDSIGAIRCLSGLEVLNLRGNRFTGSFTPRLMETFAQLTVLDVSGNRLTGAIPDEIALLSRLQRLNLRGNRFTGAFPAALGRTNTTAKTAKTSSSLALAVLDIGENSFSGAVSDEIGNLVNLGELLIDHNALSGALPASMLRLTKLKKLDISFNDFTSAPELSAIPRIDTLFVHNNHLSFAVLEGCLPSGSSAERVRFRYAPQDLIAPRLRDTVALVDAPFSLTVAVGGVNNRYLWSKNGTIVQSQSTLATLIIPAFALSDTGRYSCEITNTLLPEVRLTSASVIVSGVLPPLPTAPVELIAPRLGELDVTLTPTFAWANVMGAGRYRLQVAESNNFASLRLDTLIPQSASNLVSGRVELPTRRATNGGIPSGFPLPQDTRLLWRVRAENTSGGGAWKEGAFTTLPPDALISVQTADFGVIPRCDTAWGNVVVRNLSLSPLHLVTRTTSDNAAFLISDTLRTSTGSTVGTGGTATIPSGGEILLHTLFTPQTLGRSAGSVVMRFRIGASAVEQTQSFPARLVGRAGAAKLIAPNFGTVVVGKKRIASALFINVGDKPLILQNTTLRQKIASYSFRFEQHERLLQPNDTLTLPMSVLTDSAGSIRPDTLRCIAAVGEGQQFTREDIDTTQIPLVTFARMPDVNDVFVQIGVRTVENNLPPGSSVRLEVYIAETRSLDSIFRAALPTIRGTMRLNENVLALDRSETGARRINGTSRNQDGFQTYSIPLNNWSGRSTVLLPIRCTALAGSTDATVLVLEEIEWGAGSVIVDSLIDGAFSVKVSQAGGKRLITPTTSGQRIEIAGIAPNPVKEALDVRYTLSEGGLVEVALLDVRGNVAQLLTQEVQNAGEHTLNAKIGWLASGSYTLRISIHGESETRLVRIVR
jgi:Leucine-rich repeat (LRR) protein